MKENFVEIKKYGLPKEPDYYLCKIKGDKLPFRVLEFWKNDVDGREINEWRYNSLLKYENIDLNEVEVTHWMKFDDNENDVKSIDEKQCPHYVDSHSCYWCVFNRTENCPK